jgi:hypothetical protein
MGKKDDDIKIPVVENTNRRELYLGFLEDAIHSLHHKAVDGKVRNPQNERIKIEYFRALIYAINTANTIHRDSQLDKLEEEMRLLKQGLIYNKERTSQNEKQLDEEKLKELKDIDDKIDKLLERS